MAAKKKIAKKDALPIVDAMLETARREGRATKQPVRLSLLGRTPDQTYQTRVSGLDMDHVRRLCGMMDNGITLNPIVIYDIDGQFFVVNGFHRIEAAWAKKLTGIEAWIVRGDAHEALLYAVSANLEFSKPLSKEDMKKNAVALFSDPHCSQMSSIEIARRCGLSNTTIHHMRIAWSIESGTPLPERVVAYSGGVPVKTTAGRRTRNSTHTVMREEKDKSGRSYYRAFIGGRDTYLGSNKAQAEEKLKELRSLDSNVRETRRRNDASLGAIEEFRRLLLRFGVVAASLRGTPCAGLRIGDTFLVGASSEKKNSIPYAFGAALVAAKACPDITRFVVCGYKKDFWGFAGQIADTAGLEPFPIEFMTPEEVAAEFGPKEGQATNEAASA